jgi:hypothetical protein
MTARQTIISDTERRVRIKLAAKRIGMSEGAIRKKIERGQWVENRQWVRAPDGSVWVDLDGVQRWVLGTV